MAAAARVGGGVKPLVPVLLLVAAVVAFLLAADVRAVRSSLAVGDTVYAAAPARAGWRAETILGGTAARLLGVSDEIRLRKALQQYVAVSKLRLRLDDAASVESARARAQDALARAAGSSQARVLLGILAFEEQSPDVARSEFEAALRADPANVDAAYDLELLLRLTTAHGSRVEPGQGGGFGRTGRRGAGTGTPGSGY